MLRGGMRLLEIISSVQTIIFCILLHLFLIYIPVLCCFSEFYYIFFFIEIVV